MKRLAFAIAGASLLLAAVPAMADTTLDEVIAHGVTLEVAGMSFELTYKPDGTFSAGEFAGTYKVVDGNKLCITIPSLVDNQCSVYPDGKKSGDTFVVPGDMGDATVKIH